MKKFKKIQENIKQGVFTIISTQLVISVSTWESKLRDPVLFAVLVWAVIQLAIFLSSLKND